MDRQILYRMRRGAVEAAADPTVLIARSSRRPIS
jgi:hypothetical protein